MELIQLKEVGKVYGKLPILQNITLTVEEGDVLGVIGASGSGKTTLLNILTGFIEPSEGEVLYHSKITNQLHDLNKNLHKIKKQIGFTPQHNSFYPKLTVKENMFHFGQLYGIPQEMLVTNVKSLLQFTGLYEHHAKLAEHLSGGMQKRLDISCSLVHKPKLLVLDEPTADLDPLLQKEVLRLIQEANIQGVTVVVASHQLDGIEQVCNKVVILRQGRIFSEGLLDDVKKPFLKDHFTINVHPGSSKERIIQVLQTFPIQKIIDEGNRLVVYPQDLEQTVNKLLAFIKEENLYLHDMDMRRPSLSEVFEKIYAE